ncbi:hypothetical protein [Pedobacter sp. SL55]|uniref:hypothetical protein n=1 Tax=Pedobacter sp. SL55 TaxID=2995161 RepID=UPI00226F63FD|nr:hypothetical protein [Pedobacter sp. SL55]WAC41399.1 hypothetical protein OVA16_03270 [Pedobacter sp. SL55]
MIKILKLNFYYIFVLICSITYKPSYAITIDTPVINAGTAMLKGEIHAVNKEIEGISVLVVVPNPISGEYEKYTTFTDVNGNFSVDLHIETSVSLVSLNIGLNSDKFLITKIENSKTTVIKIFYDTNQKIESISTNDRWSSSNMINGMDVMVKVLSYKPNRMPVPLYNRSTNYFLDYAKSIVAERLKIVDNDTLVSENLKDVISREVQLNLYTAHVFDYKEEMLRNFKNTSSDKSIEPTIRQVDRLYFRFLKELKFNNPRHLLGFSFYEIQKNIAKRNT